MLTENDAVIIAKRLADFAGWDWREPHSVGNFSNTYEIVTNRGFRGLNMRVSIDKRTSKILSAVYPVRQGARTLRDIQTRLDAPNDLARYIPAPPESNATPFN